jgi:hypothetical protein
MRRYGNRGECELDILTPRILTLQSLSASNDVHKFSSAPQDIISSTKTGQLMTLRKVITVSCDENANHIYTLK